LLIADDVGLGKTIEAGLILRDLNARRRANRVLIVCPPSIMDQWQTEMAQKFGFQFKVFDRDGVLEAKRSLEAGINPWKAETRVIASRDFIKRKEGAFLELSAAHWDVVVIDEAHHVAARADEEEKLQHEMAVWLAEATDTLLLLTATPHDGYDENFASLLQLLEPTLAPGGQALDYRRYSRHLIRRLKKHIRRPDGSPVFVERPPTTGVDYILNDAERQLHKAVLARARELEEAAEAVRRTEEREAIRLVATVLRKRASSSRAALRTTLQTRRENLAERKQEIELQREYMRALKRGETLPEEVQAQLERDAHRNYLSVMRRLAGQLRRVRDESEVLDNLEDLLAACDATPESKMRAMVAWLKTVHAEKPDAKVIIFSEYVDTVDAVVSHLESSQYASKVIRLTGEATMSRPERKRALERFAQPGLSILVATDVAAEGMNLQGHCHHMLHFDLPWNPNRLEQRNGRIDRYGQTRPPVIAFLYARETYDGELLATLIRKLESEIKRLGAVGDVLGHIQMEALDRLMREAPEEELAAVRAAEAELDNALNVGRTPSDRLGTGESDLAEIARAEQAAARAEQEFARLDTFVERAVSLAGGRSTRRNDSLTVRTPPAWVDGLVKAGYDDLRAPGLGDVEGVTADNLLHEEHPLVQAAIRWVRGSRFDAQDDHRLAFAVTSAIQAPDLVATFVVTLRDGEGIEMQRLEAVRVDQSLVASKDRDADTEALRIESEGEVDTEALVKLFEDWWNEARAAAEEEALRRARAWRQQITTQRRSEDERLREEHRLWNEACRDAILGEHKRQYQQLLLFPDRVKIPSRVLRQLRHHEEREKQRRLFLDRRLQIEEPSVEPLGILLRVPRSVTRGG
jgi:superfamily II DNA or RNA helicase